MHGSNDETGNCLSSKGSSDHDDLFNDEEEDEQLDDYDIAVKKVVQEGEFGGIDVKRIAAKHFVNNKELFEEHGKTIIDCARDDGSTKIWKLDVQNLIDMLTAPPDVATQESMFGTQDEEDDEEEEEEAFDDLQEHSKAKLIAMLGEVKGTIALIEERMEKDPVKVVLKDFWEEHKKGSNKDHARALGKEMMEFIETTGFATMESEKLKLLIDCLTAMQGNKQLPKELETAKSEQKRIEAVLTQKALEEINDKVDAKAAKKVAAESSIPDKKRGPQASDSSNKKTRK